MVWQGKQEVTGITGGKHGGFIQLGDAVVPPKARLNFEGIKGSPDVVMKFEIRDGRPECVEIHVKAKPDGRGIRSSDMAQFNLDNLTSGVFLEVALSWRTEDTEEAFIATGRSIREARSSRRGAVTRNELERVAKVYTDHIDAAPTQAVAALLDYSPRTASRRVKQAEEAGLLPETTVGKRRS